MRSAQTEFCLCRQGSESLGGRLKLAVEEHEGFRVQHLRLVDADDDAVVHSEPRVAQLEEGYVCVAGTPHDSEAWIGEQVGG